MTEDSFDREKLCYQENFAQFRSLNEQMNRVPAFSVTLTGGLWFGASLSTEVDLEDPLRFSLLLLAAVANISLVLVVYRIRDVMHAYSEKIKEFHTSGYCDGRPERPKLPLFGDYSMITAYAFLMVAAAAASIAMAFGHYPSDAWGSRWFGLAIFLLALGSLLTVLLRAKTQAGRGEAE